MTRPFVAIGAALRGWRDFGGRAARPEFWWFLAFQLVVAALTAAADAALGWEEEPIGLVADLALALPALAVTVRRLRDAGHSPWSVLVLLPGIALVLVTQWLPEPALSFGGAIMLLTALFVLLRRCGAPSIPPECRRSG